MIAAELRGGNKPSLNEALGWIGSRVDDIYGASVGRLEDVWIDPGTGVPRWLLVKEGRFGGRTTLIPFEDATAGAGHVWVPYEREIVRDAPEIEPGAPLTQQVEAALRSHYAANVPAAISHRSQTAEPPPQPATPAPATATIRFATGGHEESTASAPDFGHSAPPEAQQQQTQGPAEALPSEPPQQQGRLSDPPRRAVLRGQPAAPPLSRVRGVIPPLPPRPAPPTPAPSSQPQSTYPPAWQDRAQQPSAVPYQPPQQFQPPPPVQPQPQPQYQQFPPEPQQQPGQWQAPQPQQPQQPQQQPPGQWQQQQAPPQQQAPDLQQDPYAVLDSLSRSLQDHYVEIELSGELSIRGELRSLRVIPRDRNG